MKQMIKKYFNLKKISLILLGVTIQALAINLFYVPAGLFASGLTGVAMILQGVFGNVVNYSIIYFILNIPILIIAILKLGKRFAFFTVIAVFTFTIASSLSASLIPDTLLISDEPLIMAVFGGLICGVGISLTLKAGGSTGGTDVITLLISEQTGKTMGYYAFIINTFILVVIGFLNGIEIALFTIVATFMASFAIDRLHRRYKKVTLTVITTKPAELIKDIHSKSYRGITVIDAHGAYTGEEKTILYIVVSSYEYIGFVENIQKLDPYAFINVTDCVAVYGNFHTPKLDET